MTMHARETRIRDMIEALADFTASPGKGTTRLTYSAQHRAALDYLVGRMQAAGVEHADRQRWQSHRAPRGQRAVAAAVLVGSHIDSVPNGGAFDGPAGVVAGIETAFCLQEQGHHPRRPVEVIAMIEEEGARFGGGLLGSRILTGQVDRDALSGMVDGKGVALDEAMTDFGLALEDAPDAVISEGGIHAFLELHIEQVRCSNRPAMPLASSLRSWLCRSLR